ncbi:MAG: hypothetical protein FJX52_16885 [Alphaproteobacteria bacterium]|nr:hypothetical protein [Alphaproteobacteria bacterium]
MKSRSDRLRRAADALASPQSALFDGARLTIRERMEREAARPLRGGNEAPPAGGLFDVDARNQRDLF